MYIYEIHVDNNVLQLRFHFARCKLPKEVHEKYFCGPL